MKSISGQETRRIVLDEARRRGWDDDDESTWDKYEEAEMSVLAEMTDDEVCAYNVYMGQICGLI